MAQVRSSTKTISYVPVSSPDFPRSDGTVSDELVAVSESAMLVQAVELTTEIQQGAWVETNDYNASASDPDKDDALTTSDIDNQLVAVAERADDRRNARSGVGNTQAGEASLVTVERDIDNLLYLEDLDRIVAGLDTRGARQAPVIDQELAALEKKQSFQNGRGWPRA